MRFASDPAKAAQDLKKHKVSFAEAASVFGNSMAYTFPDPDHSGNEERWLTFGMSRLGRILAIIYTERRDTIRLISARLATKYERSIYEES